MAVKTIYSLSLGMMLIISAFQACRTGPRSSVGKIISAQRSISLPDSLQAKQKKGIDLFARGSLPVDWSLEMDLDRMIWFKTAGGTSLELLPVFNKTEPNEAYESYKIPSGTGELMVKIYFSPCTEGNTDTQPEKKIEVSLNNINYSGCGKYLYNYQLNDTWILETVNNEKLAAADFPKGLPWLELDLVNMRMSGSDGCNRINSAIALKGNRIKFSAIASTRMACMNDKFAKTVSGKLNEKLVDYYFEKGKLIFYLEDDSKLIFARKEF